MTLETAVYLFHSAVSLSGLPPTPIPIDSIQQLPREEMMAILCKDGPEDCLNRRLAGAFDGEKIYLLNTLDMENMTDASFLVHEFVHVLQYSVNPHLMETCESALEAERQAYAVQNAFLKKHGQLYRAGEVLRFFTCGE